jgi:hypothetical protein
MPSAKPVFMEVRPFQVSHLCFEVGGILGESFAELGASVSAFDFGSLYNAFRAATPSKAVEHPGRLAFDSEAIDLATKIAPVVVIKDVPQPSHPAALAALRAQPLKTALDKAISARANAFITKYANAEPTIANLKETARIKGELLPRLSDGMTLQTQLLFKEYEKDGLTGVNDHVEQKVIIDGIPVKLTFEKGSVVKDVINITVSEGDTKSTVQNVVTTNTTSTDPVTQKPTSKSDSTATSTPPAGSENTRGGQYTQTRQIEYRAPSLECLARNERAQIMLRDEQFANFLQTQNLERLDEVWKNELASIDADVNQLQIAYLNTVLLSPIQGTVTGVYKNPGDTVSPGEPIFRVENDAVVLIVAQVVCRGAVRVGSFLSINTTLFNADGTPSHAFIEATIVSARGQGDDDQWEVIGKFSNIDAGGTKILPLGYRFDNDIKITQVSIFGPNEI